MGTIKYETPKGVLEFEITGDTPTPEEQEAIEASFSSPATATTEAPDPSTASYDELVKYYGGTGTDAGFSPTHEGEIEDFSFQAFYGQADNNRGREMRLSQVFGEGTYDQDNLGRFYLNLDKIAPELKNKYDLPESGTMYVNRPGGAFMGLLDLSDVAGFLGGNRGALIGGTGGAFMATGVGLIPGSIILGLTAAAGKAVDELIIENFQNLQDQSYDEIYGDIATEFIFGAGGNAALVGGGRLVRRIIKGPGTPDGQVISDLMSQGMSQGQATKVATQIARNDIRGAIKGGALPTMYEATGKPIAGRLQAIYEGIFGNKRAALANRKFVEGAFKQFKQGDMTERQLNDVLEQNARSITQLINSQMKNPDKAVELANVHLRETIDDELKILTEMFAPSSKQAKDWQLAMGQVVRLWNQDSSHLYKQAEDILGTSALFDSGIVGKQVANILKSPTGQMQKGLYDKPLFQYVLNKAGYVRNKAGDLIPVAAKKQNFNLSELNSLRHVLRAQGNDPELVGSVADHQIKELADSIDKMFVEKAAKINMNRAKLDEGGSLSYKELDMVPPKGANADQIAPNDKSQAMLDQLSDGLERLVAANNHYSDGAEILKSGAVNMLNKQINEGFFADLNKVVRMVVEDNSPEQLRRYLKAVTPSGKQIGEIQKVPAEQWKLAADAARAGDVDAVTRILKSNFVSEKTMLRPQPFLKGLSPDDPYRQRILTDMADTLDQYADDAIARAGPDARKSVNRDMLASTWFKNTKSESMSQRTINPSEIAHKFDKLGKEVQEELFGKERASTLRNTLKDFYLVDSSKVTGRLNFIDQVSNSIANPRMSQIVSGLQNDLAEAAKQSDDALFKAVSSGSIDDASSLIQAAVKNPRIIDSLYRQVGEDAFNVPGGIRDMAMQRLIKSSFPEGKITEQAVSSGEFARIMRSQIKEMDKQGGLSKIIGADTVKNLGSSIQMAEKVSDLSLKGKGGLASAAFAAGMGMRILTEPMSALGEIAGIMLTGRIMRSKPFLLWMTKPSIRARDYKLGLKAVSDQIMATAEAEGRVLTREQAEAQAINQLGELNIGTLRLKEFIATETALVSNLKLAETVQSETRQNVREAVSAVGQPIRQAFEEAEGENIIASVPSPREGALQASEVLRMEEQRKLLGLGPS